MWNTLVLATALFVQTPQASCKFDVKLAQTVEEKAKGLQKVTTLHNNEGMLFIFDQEGYEPFWMEQTEIPLALLFINSQWVIVDIQYGTPFSRTKMIGKAPYQYVLEISPKAVQNCKIALGQTVSLGCAPLQIKNEKES